jgi:sulfoxide reductase heme-binding subunit YedZ
MKRTPVILLKTLVWLICLAPLGGMVYEAFTNSLGPDPSAAIALRTGITVLRLLTASLAITPLRRLTPRLNRLIELRRLLGLFAFFYATLHMAAWAVLYAGLDPATLLTDLSRRRFIMAGAAAWLLLLPLALTSTRWAIRKLGGKRWNRLHKLVYAAAVCGVIHYWWQVKPGVRTPLAMTVVLAILLAARPVPAWMKRPRTTAPFPPDCAPGSAKKSTPDSLAP